MVSSNVNMRMQVIHSKTYLLMTCNIWLLVYISWKLQQLQIDSLSQKYLLQESPNAYRLFNYMYFLQLGPLSGITVIYILSGLSLTAMFVLYQPSEGIYTLFLVFLVVVNHIPMAILLFVCLLIIRFKQIWLLGILVIFREQYVFVVLVYLLLAKDISITKFSILSAICVVIYGVWRFIIGPYPPSNGLLYLFTPVYELQQYIIVIILWLLFMYFFIQLYPSKALLQTFVLVFCINCLFALPWELQLYAPLVLLAVVDSHEKLYKPGTGLVEELFGVRKENRKNL